MIPFFRKTCKKLADDNRSLKYIRNTKGELTGLNIDYYDKKTDCIKIN